MKWTSCLRQVSLGVTVFCLALAAHQAAQAKKSDLSAKVIYGDDDRLDYYQVRDQRMKDLAASTVALIRPAYIEMNGSVAEIAQVPIGRSYRLCKDEPFYNQTSVAFCSGFLVGPDTIITAGHCIRNQQSCEQARFVFGFALKHEQDTVSQLPAQNVYECKELVHSVAHGHGEDFAVIKLNRPVTDRPHLNLSKETANVGEGLTVIGHPSGLPTKVAGGAEVREIRSEYLVANLDTYGGNSGSAVFNTDTGEVEGILVRGETDYVSDNGCRRSNVCTNEGCRGEDVTLIKQTFPYLGAQ